MDSSHVTYGKLHGISGYDFRIVLQEQEAEQPMVVSPRTALLVRPPAPLAQRQHPLWVPIYSV